eukprot:TRINITY_DN8987_c0_g1_i4.p1 TRINITY_DN8987_c0_g1~~TRINITY_DN8987_c0_g1_i4.p1  ORF type:complete len:398 (+),score=78.40 TRINITY_DN8987_c0_g1_i4:293-1486(+)
MQTNFSTMLEVFAAPGRAVVPEEKLIKTPIGDMEMISQKMEVGDTLFMVFLAEERQLTPMMRALNPWPQYQVHCAVVFDSKKPSELPVVEQHFVPLERVLVHCLQHSSQSRWLQVLKPKKPSQPQRTHVSGQPLSVNRVLHLQKQSGSKWQLAAVTGYEQQTAQLDLKTTISSEVRAFKVKMEYISFVTGDGTAHLAAVATSPGRQPRVVSFVSEGSVNPNVIVEQLQTTAPLARVSATLHSVAAPLLTASQTSLQVHEATPMPMSEGSTYFVSVVLPSNPAHKITNAWRLALQKIPQQLGGVSATVTSHWVATAEGSRSRHRHAMDKHRELQSQTITHGSHWVWVGWCLALAAVCCMGWLWYQKKEEPPRYEQSDEVSFLLQGDANTKFRVPESAT